MGTRETKAQLKVWACSINVETTAELAALIISPFARIFFAKHAFTIDLGYENNQEFTGDQMRSELFVLVAMLCIESVTDFLAFLVETRQGIPVADYSKWMATSVLHTAAQAGIVVLSGLFTVYTFKTTPTFLSCSVEGDPCSCSGWHSAQLHERACLNASFVESIARGGEAECFR